tara:strand:- start:265 stop:987 length:723 start_codon:yes stop_codon:yes gene_type:complete
MIDIKFSSLDDTPKDKSGYYKDPDRHSNTLREYHMYLWNKHLKTGYLFNLDKYSQGRIIHKSDSKEFVLSSDSIGHTYRKWPQMKDIIKSISPDEIDSFLTLCTSIGGYVIFPAKKVNNHFTINQSRGVNKKICDRWDLTLECIKLHYLNQLSPLSTTLANYASFFNLFDDFKGYVEYFLFQDLVSKDYNSVKFYLPHSNFVQNPIPKNVDEYREYMKNVKTFISRRNLRILEYCESVSI